jgi:DNA invertase Pin-like site-specific DNA recombinase
VKSRERALIVERTKAGMEAARRRGKRIGRPPSLTPEQVAMVRRELGDGRITVSDVATSLAVSPRTIYRAISEP